LKANQNFPTLQDELAGFCVRRGRRPSTGWVFLYQASGFKADHLGAPKSSLCLPGSVLLE
jgi:hypothetical protein